MSEDDVGGILSYTQAPTSRYVVSLEVDSNKTLKEVLSAIYTYTDLVENVQIKVNEPVGVIRVG